MASQAERYGLIVMIVLGESILGQVIADREPSVRLAVSCVSRVMR